MPGHECYHCKQWIEDGEAHDCWTTTEAALMQELSDELRDAWERLRETAAGFGDQRIYASHHCIMFSRKSCYFFVRPKMRYLELCVFLGRPIKAPQIRRRGKSSKAKIYNIIRVVHRDEVEPPITDWLREAYEVSDELSAGSRGTVAKPLKSKRSAKKKSKPAAAKKRRAKSVKATGKRMRRNA
jgi:hypothetical protein